MFEIRCQKNKIRKMNKNKLRRFLKSVFPILDVLPSPFTFLASILLFTLRKMRIADMPISKWIFKRVGVFPITNHYYELMFDDRLLKLPLDKDRFLPGINWKDEQQLDLLRTFQYQNELTVIPYQIGGFSYMQ